MKKFPYFVSLLVLLVCSSGTFAQDKKQSSEEPFIFTSWSTTRNYAGNKYVFALSVDDLAGTSSWEPTSGEPPLSIGDALAAGRSALPRFVNDLEKWEVDSVELVKVFPGKWVYDISLSAPSLKDARNQPARFTILVKMDGLIFEPKISPERKDRD